MDNFDLGALEELLTIKKKQTGIDVEAALHSARVDPMAEVEEPPVIIFYKDTAGHQSPLCTLGNFSLLIGKAKSRKTFLITSIAAAAIRGESSLSGLVGTLGKDKQTILFDTEQAPFHLHRTVRRICKQAQRDNPENFEAYGLRPYTPADRLAIIESKIRNTSNAGLVIIDGVRDLMSRGINDEEESTTLISKILKWTFDGNLHILLVLHQNKNDQNARGHIGTEAVNKAETVLSVQKDQGNTVVKPEYTRDIDFEPFAFFINAEGLPELTPMFKQVDNKLLEIKENFLQLLPGMTAKSYADLVNDYKEIAGIAEPTAKRHIRTALRNGILVKSDTGKYKIKNQIINDPEDPF